MPHQPLPSELADILYHVRCALEGLKGQRSTAASIARQNLEYAQVAADHLLRRLGADPGQTALDADMLKVRLMKAGRDPAPGPDEAAVRIVETVREVEKRVEVPKIVERVVEKVVERVVEVPGSPDDTVQKCLERAAEASGTEGVPFAVRNELDRFQQFCFWGLHHPPESIGLTPRHASIYITAHDWLVARCPDGVPFDDLPAMSKLYLQWTKEGSAAFLRRLGMGEDLARQVEAIEVPEA